MFHVGATPRTLLVALVALAACSRQPAQPAAGSPPLAAVPAAAADPYGGRQPDERTLAEDAPYEARHGKADCLDECLGHEAGYRWAALHSLTDARACSSQDRGFIVGCRAYVADHGRG